VHVDRQTREAIATTLTMLREQLSDLIRFQSLLIVFLQHITPYVDTRDRDAAGVVRGLSGAINEVADELLKRTESTLARQRRHDLRMEVIEQMLVPLQQQIQSLAQAVEHLIGK